MSLSPKVLRRHNLQRIWNETAAASTLLDVGTETRQDATSRFVMFGNMGIHDAAASVELLWRAFACTGFTELNGKDADWYFAKVGPCDDQAAT